MATIGAYGTIAEVQGNLIMQSAPLSVLLMGDTVFVAGKPIDLDHNKFLKSAQKKGYATLLNLAIHNSYHGKDGMTMQTEGKHGLPVWEGGAAWMKANQAALGVRAMAPRTFNQKPAVRGLQVRTLCFPRRCSPLGLPGVSRFLTDAVFSLTLCVNAMRSPRPTRQPTRT